MDLVEEVEGHSLHPSLPAGARGAPPPLPLPLPLPTTSIHGPPLSAADGAAAAREAARGSGARPLAMASASSSSSLFSAAEVSADETRGDLEGGEEVGDFSPPPRASSVSILIINI